MEILWTAAAFGFTFAVLAAIVFTLARITTAGRQQPRH